MDIMKLLNGVLLILALTTDSLVVSFSYGMENVKIPFPMVIGMNLIMSILLGIAIFTGNFLAEFLPKTITSGIGILLLSGMGIYRIFHTFMQKTKKTRRKKLKIMTGVEAILLAFALSFDSLAVGIGTGLVENRQWALVTGAFVSGVVMMEVGWKLGKKFFLSIRKDFSWFGGVCLLLLAAGLWLHG